MNFTMKTGLALLCAAVGLTASAWEVDLNGATLHKNKTRGWYVKSAQKKVILHFSASAAADEKLLGVKLENGALTIDARKYYEKNKTKSYILLHWVGPKKSEFSIPAAGKTFSDKANVMRTVGSANVPGLQICGNIWKKGEKSRGFYLAPQEKSSRKLPDGSYEVTTKQSRIPSDATSVNIRSVISMKGVYTVRSASLKVEDRTKETFENRNWIPDGNAETMGMYCPRVGNDYRYSQFIGYYLDWKGKIFEFTHGKTEIDASVRHSGNHSFRVSWDGSKKSYSQNIGFAPVPVKMFQPVSFSAWIKGKEPCWVSLSLGLNGGCNTRKNFKVTTEWKRYEFYIPSWGETNPHMASYSGSELNLVSPSVSLLQKGTIWVDDASFSLGGHSRDSALEDLYLYGSMDRDESWYDAGTPIKVKVSYNQVAKRKFSGTLGYEIRDFRGRLIKAGKLKDTVVDPAALKSDFVTIQPPEKLRGAFNLTVSLQEGKKKYSMEFYAGIMEKNPKLSTRIGLDYSSNNENSKKAVPFYKAFRIGWVRLWWNPVHCWQKTGFQEAGFFHKNGIRVLLNLNTGTLFKPKDHDAILKQMEENMKAYRGMVETYESINETNLIPGITPELNVENMRLISESIRKNDPGAKLAGPACCATDLAWTETVLSKGAAKYLDAITEHPYRHSPEVPDYAEEVQAWRTVLDRYKKGMPHWAGEAGRTYPVCFTQNRISDPALSQSAKDIRNILQSFAGGVERYMQFAYGTWIPGQVFKVTYHGNFLNHGTVVPGLVMYGIRAILDRLEDAKIDRRVKFGSDYRCYIFDHGKKRTAVFWKWNGLPSKIRFEKKDESSIRAYDMMGTELALKDLDISEYPCYLDSNLSADELEKLLKRASLINDADRKIEIGSGILDEKSFKITLRNLTGKKIDGKVIVKNDGIVAGSPVRELKGIPAEEVSGVVYQLKDGKIGLADKKIQIEVRTAGSKPESSEINLQGMFAVRTGKTLKIDGDLSDWPADARVIKLDRSNVRFKTKNWGEKEDKVHADIRFAWDFNYLYFSAVVYKPDFHQAVRPQDLSRLWRYDGFQFGFDTLRNSISGQTRLGDDDYEYDFGMLQNQPVFYCRRAASSSYDGLSRTLGRVDQIVSAIKRYPDRVVYEAAFPRRSIGPFKLAPGNSMKVGVLLNLNNGKERVGFMEVSDGIGKNPKRPDQWIDLVLCK